LITLVGQIKAEFIFYLLQLFETEFPLLLINKHRRLDPDGANNYYNRL